VEKWLIGAVIVFAAASTEEDKDVQLVPLSKAIYMLSSLTPDGISESLYLTVIVAAGLKVALSGPQA